MNRSLTFQMGALFVGRIASFAFSFAVPMILARLFTLEEFGLYKLIFLIHGTLMFVWSGGLPWSLYYFRPKSTDLRATYATQALLLLVAIGIVGWGVLVAFRAEIAVFLNNPALDPILPSLGLLIFLTSVASVLEMTMIAERHAALAAATILVSEIVRSLSIVVACLLAPNAQAVIDGMLVFGGLRLAASIAYFAREGLLRIARIDRATLTEQLRYSLPFYFATMAEVTASAAPQYFVSSRFDAATFAVFAVGCLTVPLVPLLFDSVSDVALVRMTESVRAGKLDEVLVVISDSVRKLCLVCFPLCLFLVCFARDFVLLLFTSKFEASVPIFRIFMLMVPLAALSLEYVPRAFAETPFVLLTSIARLLATGALLAALTPVWQIEGAALAWVGGHAVSRALAFFRVRRLTATSVRNLLPWSDLARVALGSAAAVVPAIALASLADDDPFRRLAIGGIAFGLAYAALTWRLNLVSQEEKGAVTRCVERVRTFAFG